MKTQRRLIIVLALLITFLSVYTVSAQTDQRVNHIKQYLHGQKLRVSYREGGPLYGTHVVLDIHYCPTGQYMLFGQSLKRTILDNMQENSWEDRGHWDVIRFQGQVGVQYFSTSGERNVVPVRLLPDGGIWVNDGVSIQQQGRAQCR